MKTQYELRQQVKTVQKAWLVLVASGGYERPLLMEYDRVVREHPGEYFELVRVETQETCIAYTPMAT